MGTEAPDLLNGTKTLPAAPALPLVRARSRVTRDDGGAAAATPSLGTPVTVPFLWEDAPGRPKPHRGTTVPAAAAAPGGGRDEVGDAKTRLVPLKLPPRLQAPPSAAAADRPLSPETVLQGPYRGCAGSVRRPPLRRGGSLRRTPSAGGGFFSRRKAAAAAAAWAEKKDRDASCTPSPSSASSSSSSSSYVFFSRDDSRGHGARPDHEEAEGAKESVRITRFRRNRSLPTMTTSHLWASIRKGVKKIAPWS